MMSFVLLIREDEGNEGQIRVIGHCHLKQDQLLGMGVPLPDLALHRDGSCSKDHEGHEGDKNQSCDK